MIIGLVLLLFLVGLWLWPIIWSRRILRKLKLEISIGEHIVDSGDDIHILCNVANYSRLSCPQISCMIELSENLLGNNPAHPSFAQFATHLGGRKLVTARVTVKAIRRGIGRIAQAHLTLRDGLGLRSFHMTLAVDVSVIVRPKHHVVPDIPIQMTSLIGELRIRRFYNEDTSLLQGIRPYQEGDSYKHISWLSTARSQQLMVKEFGYTTSTRCLICLSAETHTRQPREVFDRLCECTLAISSQLIEKGFQVGLITNALNVNSRDYYDPPSGTWEQIERIRNRLGTLEPIPLVPLDEFLHTVAKHAHPGEMVVILSGRLAASGYYSLRDFSRRTHTLFVYMVSKSLDRGMVPYDVPIFHETI